MMNYAPGADAPREVRSRDTQPAPPVSSEASNYSNMHSPDGIDYSDRNTRASRRGIGDYFDLDSETRLPIPFDDGGFLRVSTVDTRVGSLLVAYRIKSPLFGVFGKLRFTSREVDSVILSTPEPMHEDILSASLVLMERRKSSIENYSRISKRLSSVSKLCGDYHPRRSRS